MPRSLCSQASLVSNGGLVCASPSQGQSVGMSVFPSLQTHFHNTCRCPQAEHLYFSTVFKGYEGKEGAQTDRHAGPTTTVFFKKATGKKTDQALFFLVRRRDNFLLMIQRCHVETMTVLHPPHSFVFKTLLMPAHLSR